MNLKKKKKVCAEAEEVAVCPFQVQPDRSVPILVGAGGRSSMADHSKTLLFLQIT